jgi:hypothetical protein
VTIRVFEIVLEFPSLHPPGLRQFPNMSKPIKKG